MKENFDDLNIQEENLYEDWDILSEEEEERVKEEMNEEYKYSSNPIINEYYKSIEEENKQAYRDYINRHQKNMDDPNIGQKEVQTMVSKAMAAQILLDSPVQYEYSPRLITFVAERIDKALELGSVNTGDLKEVVKDHQATMDLMTDRITKIYTVKNPKSYIDKMKKLSSALMSREGRSEEFKDFPAE